MYRLVSQVHQEVYCSDTHARTTTLFDVVTCCPTHHNSSTNLCRNAATMPGKAAGDGEIYKRKKWLHHCQAMDLLFVPLAHENGGRMGEAARKFLDRLVLSRRHRRRKCYSTTTKISWEYSKIFEII